MAEPQRDRESIIAIMKRRMAWVVPRAGIARTTFGIVSVAVVVMVVGVACMGEDEGPRRGPTFTMATFTPAPPNYTPEAIVTRAAQATEWSLTATAAPPVTATPPQPTSVPGENQTPVTEDEIRPPDLILTTDGGQTDASIGSFNWCSVVLNQCADIRAGYVVLTTGIGSWSAGSAGTITTPNTDFPPLSAEAALYVYEDNVAIPQDVTGTIVGNDLAFVPQTPPVQVESFTGAEMTMTPTVEPGRYLLVVQMNWTTPQEVQRPMHTQYAFVVEIL